MKLNTKVASAMIGVGSILLGAVGFAECVVEESKGQKILEGAAATVFTVTSMVHLVRVCLKEDLVWHKF